MIAVPIFLAVWIGSPILILGVALAVYLRDRRETARHRRLLEIGDRAWREDEDWFLRFGVDPCPDLDEGWLDTLDELVSLRFFDRDEWGVAS